MTHDDRELEVCVDFFAFFYFREPLLTWLVTPWGGEREIRYSVLFFSRHKI